MSAGVAVLPSEALLTDTCPSGASLLSPTSADGDASEGDISSVSLSTSTSCATYDAAASTIVGASLKTEIKESDTKFDEADDLALSNANVAKARADTSGRVYRVYCDGIFDLFHLGHMNMLKQAKHMLGPGSKTHLLVGVCNDSDTHREKGLTVLNEQVRYESVRHCKWVDEVIPDAPWTITDEFLKKHNIDFVAHDAIPYAQPGTGVTDVYGHVKKSGKFLTTQRTDGISTSDIIVTIVKDYDAYVDRNLSRGYDKKSLNVGKTWEIRMVAHEKSVEFDKALGRLKQSQQELKVKVKQFVREFNRNAFKSANGDREVERKNAEQRAKLGDEAIGVVKYTVSFAGSLCSTVMSGLSYLNVFSYVQRCKKYNKKKSS